MVENEPSGKYKTPVFKGTKERGCMKGKRLIKHAKIFVFLFILLILPVGMLGVFAEETAPAQRLSSNPAESTEIEWLIFSPTKYQHERYLVKKYEHVTKKDSKFGDIYIALADLDGDGVKEIFAYITIGYYCGTLGCPFGIYQIRGNKLVSLLDPEFKNGGFPISIDFDKEGRQKVIGILQTKTMGWRDISLEGKTIWKWNGKNY